MQSLGWAYQGPALSRCRTSALLLRIGQNGPRSRSRKSQAGRWPTGSRLAQRGGTLCGWLFAGRGAWWEMAIGLDEASETQDAVGAVSGCWPPSWPPRRHEGIVGWVLRRRSSGACMANGERQREGGERQPLNGRACTGTQTTMASRQVIGPRDVTEASRITQDHGQPPYHDAQPLLVRAAACIILHPGLQTPPPIYLSGLHSDPDRTLECSRLYRIRPQSVHAYSCGTDASHVHTMHEPPL